MGTFKFLRMYFRAPFLLLALLEFLLCVFAVFIAVYVRFDGSQITEIDSIRSPVATSMLFGLVMPGTLMAMGLYQSRFRGGLTGVFLRSLLGFAVGAVILALLYYMIPSLYLGRGVFAIAVIVAFLMVGAIRVIFFHSMDSEALKLRVMVFGVGEKAASIDRRLRRRVDRRGFRIAGYLRAATDDRIVIEPQHLLDLDFFDQTLLEYARAHSIDEIVVAVDERRGGLPLQQLLDCRLHGVDIIDLLAFFEREQGRLPLEFLRPDWLIFSEGSERGVMAHVFKRAFDIVASLLILGLSWPLMLAAGLAIKLEDGLRAPVLYRQTRVGYLARNFQVLKFRSMVVNAEQEHGAQWAAENDQRITRAGHFLRKSRIDELPQLFNVLSGDMSFVGPRPERPHFVCQLSQAVPFYKERHAVKPGITGWAQVRFPYAATFQDAALKHEYDLFYIKNHSIFLDFIILCQTAEVVLFGKGAR